MNTVPIRIFIVSIFVALAVAYKLMPKAPPPPPLLAAVCDPSTVRPGEDWYRFDAVPLFIFVRAHGPKSQEVADAAMAFLKTELEKSIPLFLAPLPAMKHERSPSAKVLSDSVRAASAAVHGRFPSEGEFEVAVVLVHDTLLVEAHVGASRLALVRNNQVLALDDAHTVASERQRKIATELHGLPPQTLTRAVGRENDVEVDMVAVDLVPGDHIVFVGMDDERILIAASEESTEQPRFLATLVRDYSIASADRLIRELSLPTSVYVLSFRPRTTPTWSNSSGCVRF